MAPGYGSLELGREPYDGRLPDELLLATCRRLLHDDADDRGVPVDSLHPAMFKIFLTLSEFFFR